MPSRSTLDAGKAVITLSLNDQVSKHLKSFEAKFTQVGASLQRIGTAGLGITSAIAAPFLQAVKVAADAQESLSRFSAVMKEQAAAADKFATDLAKSVGRSAIEIKDGLSSLQGFFVGLGFTADRSRELSQQLQALSIDFASFNNISDVEALCRFISALSGSSEVLDKFGINTKVAALENELLTMGIRKSWATVTEQEKALARLNVIMKSMGAQGAVGDAVRTSGSLTNQLKALQAQAKDAAVAGTALIPSATELISQANGAAQKFAKWAGENMKLVTSTAELTLKMAALSAAMIALGTAARVTSTAVATLRIAMVALGSHPVLAGIAAATAGIVGLNRWLEKSYHTADRVGKRIGEMGPPRPLTEEEAKGGPYMSDLYGNPILDMTVADYYGDGKEEPKPSKLNKFSNGKSIGNEQGSFSNGLMIGGPNDVWDNPRPVPFAATPSIDPMQQQLADLGLNQHQLGGEVPTGTFFQDVFEVARDAMMEKVRAAARQFDDQFGPTIDEARERIDKAIEGVQEFIGRDKVGSSMATLDASFAAQQFGGRSREVELLDRVARATERTEEHIRNLEPGLPIGGPG